MWTQRYKKTYCEYTEAKAPGFFKMSGGYGMKLTYPKVTSANGLTQAICKYLEWCGHRATRINVQGRLVDKQVPAAGGGTITVKGWQTSSTRRGTADISATIFGRSVMLEIKIGKDKPSEYQLAEQQRERSAGGIYEFIKTMDEFYTFYDQFILSLR